MALVTPLGLEPRTYRLKVCCYYQLSYRVMRGRFFHMDRSRVDTNTPNVDPPSHILHARQGSNLQPIA